MRAQEPADPRAHLAWLPPELTAPLHQGVARGRLPAAWLRRCLEQTGLEPERLLTLLLPLAAASAAPAVSAFPVGAVAMGMPRGADGLGDLYLGANREFPGQALPASIHAEQSAVNNAWLHGETGLQLLAASAPPCGYCRQFLAELSTADRGLRLLFPGPGGDAGQVVQSLAALLPHAFGPGDLGIAQRLMAAGPNRLRLETRDPLARCALEAADGSYAPYTGAYAGVALRDAGGRRYPGRYAENAAYNPSLLPMQSALAFMQMQPRGRADREIVAAALVASPAGGVDHRSAAESLLSAVAPGVRLEYHPAPG